MMMRFLLISMLFSCNPKTNVEKPEIKDIVVKFGQSNKIDLAGKTYTVYFVSDKPYECKFTLSAQDSMDILKMSQEYGLANLKGNILFTDNCQMFPLVMTNLSYYVGDSSVQVTIDENCDKFPQYKNGEPEGVVKFLKFLRERLEAKPEIAKAPRTDISYH